MLRLIIKYRDLENAPLSRAYLLIREVAPKDIAAHVRDKWHHHQKDFASFYLNLDYGLQLRFLNFWGVADLADFDFVRRKRENPRETLFEEPSGFLSTAKRVLLYFNNAGIGDSNDKVRHYYLPENRYGNSANWGKYLLSLNMAEQVRIIMEILNDK